MVCKIKLKKGNVPDWKFNKRQLRIGTGVETEHTNSRKIAKQIAKAHLSEFPLYYVYLSKMESKLKKMI